MERKYVRRHSYWYERFIFSRLFQFFVGGLVVVLLPLFIKWPVNVLEMDLNSGGFNTAVTIFLSYLIVFLILRRIRNFPGTQTFSYIFPSVAFVWLLFMAGLLFFKLEYSRHVVIASYIISNLWFLAVALLRRKYRKPKLAVVPIGGGLEVLKYDSANSRLLKNPDLNNCRFDAIVADLRATDLPHEWERFLARCVLSGIPVYHYKHVLESLTGRVKIEHLSENIFGSLQPSEFYSFLKRVGDLFLVVVSTPIWVPIIFFTGVFIKLESRGPVFFTQERVGQGNRSFTVFKLRSMCQESEKNGAQFASANDARITRIGHFIRKTRIDELPQFINVLMGNMSLIGPRPEQRVFVEQFEHDVPFYSYRHVVKPGITGWAQVTHGYAADADDTKIKIEHDFYYIKHFSLWLDILIVAKTIRTIFTGFGAR